MLSHGILPLSTAASIYLFEPPYAIGPVPSLSDQTIAYRWRSLPRARRPRASNLQGSSSNVCCLLRYHHGPIDVRLSFPTPTVGILYSIRLPILARGQLNRQTVFPCLPSYLRIWSRETGLAVPPRVSSFILHTQAESGAYSRDSSRFLRRRPFIPSTTIGSAPSISVHAIAYRWRSPPESAGTRPVVLEVVRLLERMLHIQETQWINFVRHSFAQTQWACTCTIQTVCM